MIAAASAAAWHGVRSASVGGRVRVNAPYRRPPRSHGFPVVRRTRRSDPHPVRAPSLWIASPARAVADAAREAGRERARAIVLESVQRRIPELGELRHHLEAGP